MYKPQRLHPAMILLTFLQSLREMLIPLIFIVISFLRDQSFQWWSLVGLVAIFVFVPISSFLRWFRYYYYLSEREVCIEYGVFVRKQRFIPYERIRSISLTQGLIHRVFGLVKFQMDTAGGSDELQALSRERAEQLREAILSERDLQSVEIDAGDEADLSTIQYTLTTKDLLIAASTSGGLGIIFSFIGALFSQLDNILPERFFTGFFNKVISSSVLNIFLLVGLIALIAWLVAIINVMLRFGGFVLKKKQDELLIERGIIEKKQMTIPTNKIQAIRVEEGLLRQPFHLAAISIDVAGSSSLEADQTTVIHPLIRRHEIEPFLQSVLPDFAVSASFESIPKRARRRYIIRHTWIYLLLMGLAMWLLPMKIASFSLLLLIFGVVIGELKYRDAGWLLTDEAVGIRFRRWGRTSVFTLRKRIQSHEKRQTFFQRRRRLATFLLSIIGGFGSQTFMVYDLEKEDAAYLYNELRQKITM